jgi:hypothetical protein
MSLPRPEIVALGGGRSPAIANLAKVDDRRGAFPSPRERREWWGGYGWGAFEIAREPCRSNAHEPLRRGERGPLLRRNRPPPVPSPPLRWGREHKRRRLTQERVRNPPAPPKLQITQITVTVHLIRASPGGEGSLRIKWTVTVIPTVIPEGRPLRVTRA